MILTAAELVFVQSKGLHITEKCDGCGKLLNQSVRYTIAQMPEVYCSAECRDFVFFGNRHKARKQATPGKCAFCGGSLSDKKRGAVYCNDTCRMRHSRVRERNKMPYPEKSRTSAQSNQQVVDTRTVKQGNCIAEAQSGFKRAVVGVSSDVESLAKVHQGI